MPSLAFAPILFAFFGPWGGIIGAVLSAFAWFGLAQFGGYIGAILTLLVLGVNLMIFFLSFMIFRGWPSV